MSTWHGHPPEVFTEPCIPTIPLLVFLRKTKVTMLAEKTWTYLMLPSMVILKGETVFLLESGDIPVGGLNPKR